MTCLPCVGALCVSSAARTSRDQLETLYEARGHEIGRLRADLERLRTDAAAELRASRHQAALAAADGQGLQTSLQQAQNLLGTTRRPGAGDSVTGRAIHDTSQAEPGQGTLGRLSTTDTAGTQTG